MFEELNKCVTKIKVGKKKLSLGMAKTRLFRKKIEDKIIKIKVGKKKLSLGMTKIKVD